MVITLITLLLAFQQNPWVTQPVDVPDLYHVIYDSEAIQGEASFHIYIPPAYFDDEDQHFPVLYYLHGGGGGLQGLPILRNYFHNNMQNGTLPEMIVVFPWGLPFGMWVNSKDGSQPVESLVIEDLIPYVDANYRTIANRSGRIVEGFSMGGYGAARFGLLYPDLFAGFSMLGAGPLQLDFINYPHVRTPLPQRLEIFNDVYGNDMAFFEAMSPWRIAEAVVDDLPENYPIRMVVGDEDELLIMNQELREHWESIGLPFDYIEVPDAPHAAMAVLMWMTQNGKQSFYREVFSLATNITPEPLEIPASLHLHQNYPNPFNPSTTIRFELAEAGHTTLGIYDITGRKVAGLVNETHPAGSHSIPFNAKQLATGIYVYRLTTPAGTLSRKMVLVK